MEPLTLNDTQSLLQGIQTLYTFCNLETFGVDALSILNQIVSSDLTYFHVTNVRARQVSHTFQPDFPGFTSEMERVIHQHFGEHPLLHHLPQTLNGVYQISDFVSQKELHHLESFYQQFLRPLGTEEQMVLFLPHARSGSWSQFWQTDVPLVGFALHRTRRNFTERDRLILNHLRPHLFQAYCNAQHHHQLQQQVAQLHQDLSHLGLIVLNRIGQIQFTTPLATQWLQTYFAKPTHSNQLPEHLWAWVNYQISGFTNNHLLTACLPLHIEQADKQLMIRLVIEQMGERYLLLLEEQTLSWLNSLDLLGLSPREADVLSWVIRGRDNQSIASRLGIHISTVRKHLESIYRKLDVQSRAEAIAQALGKLGILHQPPLD